MAAFAHKRGDTFVLNSDVETEGVAVDITGWTIASQIRDRDDIVIQTLTVTITDAVNGRLSLSATPTQTELWPVSSLFCDIEFIDDTGVVTSTETFTINVLLDITRV